MLDRLASNQDIEDGFEVLWKVINNRSKKEFLKDPALKQALKKIILKFDDVYIQLEEFLGDGHWSLAFKAVLYDIQTQQPSAQEIVLKIEKPEHKNFVRRKWHQIEDSAVKQEVDFKKEALLFDQVYGFGVFKKMRIQNQMVCAMLTPFLGTPLSSLLKETYTLKHIPIKEWLSFFLLLFQRLEEFYQKTNGLLHNDIKPPNITIFLKDLPQRLLGFESVHLIDFGNAQPRKKSGRFGDLRYNSAIKGLGGLVINWKDYGDDTYASGNTLLEVIKKLKKIHRNELDTLVLNQCQKLFQGMRTLMNDQISLGGAKEQMRSFCNAYLIAEENEKKSELLQDLTQFIQRSNFQLAQQTKNSCFCYGSSLFATNNRKLTASIQAAEKVLRLIQNEEVVFSKEELEAYHTGELGKIMSKHRLHARLPVTVLEFECSFCHPEPIRFAQD